MLSTFVNSHPSVVDSTLTVLHCDNKAIDVIDIHPLFSHRFVLQDGSSSSVVIANSNTQRTELNVAIVSLIKTVILSRNLIRELDGIFQFSNCHTLNLSNNRISTIDACRPLHTMQKLKVLTLAGNPVCRLPNYRAHVLSITSGESLNEGNQNFNRFCRLQSLDNIVITLDEELNSRLQLRHEQIIIGRLSRKKRLNVFLESYVQRKFLHAELHRRGAASTGSTSFEFILSLGVCGSNPSFETSHSTHSLRKLVSTQRNRILSQQFLKSEGVSSPQRDRPSWPLAFEAASNYLDDEIAGKLLTIAKISSHNKECDEPDLDFLALLCSSSWTPRQTDSETHVKRFAFLTWRKEAARKLSRKKQILRSVWNQWVRQHEFHKHMQRLFQSERVVSFSFNRNQLRSCFTHWKCKQQSALSQSQKSSQFLRCLSLRHALHQWKLAFSARQRLHAASLFRVAELQKRIVRKWHLALGAARWGQRIKTVVFQRWKHLACSARAVRHRQMSKLFNRWVLRMLSSHRKRYATMSSFLHDVPLPSAASCVHDESTILLAPADEVPSPHPPPYLIADSIPLTDSAHVSTVSDVEASPVDHSASLPQEHPTPPVDHRVKLHSGLKTFVEVSTVSTSTNTVLCADIGTETESNSLADTDQQPSVSEEQKQQSVYYEQELDKKHRQLEWALETIRTLQSRVSALESIERSSTEMIHQYERELAHRDLSIANLSFRQKRVQ